eukprot:3840005-Rhodomonas_salina.4
MLSDGDMSTARDVSIAAIAIINGIAVSSPAFEDLCGSGSGRLSLCEMLPFWFFDAVFFTTTFLAVRLPRFLHRVQDISVDESVKLGKQFLFKFCASHNGALPFELAARSGVVCGRMSNIQGGCSLLSLLFGFRPTRTAFHHQWGANIVVTPCCELKTYRWSACHGGSLREREALKPSFFRRKLPLKLKSIDFICVQHHERHVNQTAPHRLLKRSYNSFCGLISVSLAAALVSVEEEINSQLLLDLRIPAQHLLYSTVTSVLEQRRFAYENFVQS